MELDYLNQLQKKESLLSKSLEGMPVKNFLPTIQSKTTGFRNKAKLSVTGTISSPIIGLIGEDDKDAGREILNCPLHHPKINQVIEALKPFISKANLAPYQISEKKGELKGLILFYSETSNEMYLRFILRSKEAVTRLQKYIKELQNQFPYLVCISINIQPIPHAILEGEEEIFLTERKFVLNKIGQFEFEIDPKAFVQTNQEIAKKLYETAASWVDEVKPQKFTELFCGQGAFSFFSLHSFKESLGIEINKEAVEKANQMAASKNLKNVHFKCADAASVESELENFSPDLVLVNPPRRGLGKSIELLTKTIYPQVIYSSCSYETLGQDLKKLEEFYNIEKVQLFDMFPNTDHFETLVLLTRK